MGSYSTLLPLRGSLRSDVFGPPPAPWAELFGFGAQDLGLRAVAWLEHFSALRFQKSII